MSWSLLPLSCRPGPWSHPHHADLVLVLVIPITSSCPGPYHPCRFVASSSHHPDLVPVILVVSSCPGPCCPRHVVLAPSPILIMLTWSWSLSSLSCRPVLVSVVLITSSWSLFSSLFLSSSSCCPGPCHPCCIVLVLLSLSVVVTIMVSWLLSLPFIISLPTL